MRIFKGPEDPKIDSTAFNSITMLIIDVLFYLCAGTFLGLGLVLLVDYLEMIIG